MSGETKWWVLWIEHIPTGNHQDLAVEAKDAATAVKLVTQIIGEGWEWSPSSGVEPLIHHR